MDRSEDYVGDKIEFVDMRGLWHTRVLRQDKDGLYIIHHNEKKKVKQWGNDSIGYRFREAK